MQTLCAKQANKVNEKLMRKGMFSVRCFKTVLMLEEFIVTEYTSSYRTGKTNPHHRLTPGVTTDDLQKRFIMDKQVSDAGHVVLCELCKQLVNQNYRHTVVHYDVTVKLTLDLLEYKMPSLLFV